MNLNDGMHLIYLVLLLVFVGGGIVLYRRVGLGQIARGGLGWLVIFLVVIAAYGIWDERTAPNARNIQMHAAGNTIEIPRARDGHFYLALIINGASVPVLVDTGATELVLTKKDAARAGLDLDTLAFTGRARTANGETRTAPVRLAEVSLGPITDTNVRAWVNEGEMDRSLLGMSYLQRWDRMEITRDALILTR